ncbi:MAG: ABC transporter ATP-binding protein [Boseongicola sp. SB0677_bin_26]|nr:ABC transporter ATP-binding protein [Boseongicola sp. SB0665_bin_10]MYG26090.1 ABC transporter ATP-binding protein [Boseongicola sp. SB0677_bin_26]
MTVVLDAVSKSFGNVKVLHELSLEVQDGEFLVLLGASGSGKSTALRMIAGLETVSGGRISISGRDVTDELPKNRDVAMVFQSYALYPHKTVSENIGYPLKIRRMNRAEIESQVREVAAQVRIGELLERYPRELSGGQRQRVALARAMVRRPSVFLMDEPLSNLDAKLRGHMRAELKHMQHELGITTIYVTHDQIEAMTLAHRVALLEGGRLQQLAAPKTIYEDPENLFVAQFIGSPPMNVAHGRLDAGTFVIGADRVATGGTETVANAVVGLRAEDCQVVAPEDGAIRAQLFANELIGDHTLVTAKIGDDMVSIKAPKEFEAGIDEAIGIAFETDRLYLFDKDTGARIRRS